MKFKALVISFVLCFCMSGVTTILASDDTPPPPPPSTTSTAKKKLTGSDKMRINGYANESKLRVEMFDGMTDEEIEAIIIEEVNFSLTHEESLLAVIPLENYEFEIIIIDENTNSVDSFIY